MAYIPLAQFKKKESGYIPIAQLRGEKLEPIEPVSIDLGLDLFGTKTTTPAILPQGFLTPQTLLKVMGQGIARQWTATGAKIAQKTKLASNDIVDPKSYFGDSPTARALGVSIFGKTEPFNATSEDVETLETFGADPEAVKKFSGSLTILFSTLDVLGAEPFKGVVGLIRTLKRADNAIDVARAMKSVGFADDVIEVYRDVFVPLKTTKEVKTALDAALSLQSKTTGKGYRPVADLMRETGEVAPRVADETFQPLAQEARKFKTAEEFVEVQMPEIPNKPYSLYLGEDIYFSGKIRGKWTDIVFDRRKNNFEVRDLSYGGGSEKFGSLNEAKSYIKSQLTDFYNQAVRGVKEITSPEELRILETEFAKDMGDIRELTKLTLFKDIERLGGIKSFAQGELSEELSAIPLRLRNNKTGSTLDDLATQMSDFGYTFKDGEELREAILQTEQGKVRISRPEIQAFREAKKQRALDRFARQLIRDNMVKPLQLPPGRRIMETISPKPPLITRPEDVLLRERIRAEARGAKEAAGTIRVVLRARGERYEQAVAELDDITKKAVETLRNKTTDIVQKKQIITDYAKTKLSPDLRGRLLSAVASARTEGDVANAIRRINILRNNEIKKEIVTNIEEVIEKIDALPPNQQKKAIETIEGLTAETFTEKTKTKLSELKEFIQKEPEAVFRFGAKTLKKTERAAELGKKSLEDVSIRDLIKINDRLDFLMREGKLAEKTTEEIKGLRVENALKEITDSVPRNLDEGLPPPRKPGEPVPSASFSGARDSTIEAIRKGTQYYVTPDVGFQILDNDKQFGANWRTFKRPIDAAQDFENGMRNAVIDDLFERVDDIEIRHGKLNAENYDNVFIYAGLRQEGIRAKFQKSDPRYFTDAFLDSKEIITEGEMEFYKLGREIFDELRPHIEDVLWKTRGEKLGKVDNYWSLMTDFDNSDELFMRLSGDYKLSSRTEQGFTKSRTLAGTQKYNFNALDVLVKHINDASAFIAKEELLNHLSKIARSDKYAKSVGKMGQKWVAEWLDLLARGGIPKGYKPGILTKLVRNVGHGVLGFRISPIVKQPLAKIVSTGFLGVDAFKYDPQFFTDFGIRDAIHQISKQQAFRNFDDPAYTALAKAKRLAKWQEWGYKGIKTFDSYTADSVWYAAYRHNLNQRNLDFSFSLDEFKAGKNVDNEAKEYADLIVRRTQGGSEYKDASLLYASQSNKDLTMAFLQFQRFIHNQSILWRDAKVALMKEKDPIKAAAIAASLVAAGIAESYVQTGIAQLFSSEDYAEKEREKNIGARVFNSITGQLPVISNLTSIAEYGGSGVPAWDVASKGYQGAISTFTAKRTETKIKGAIRAGEAAASLGGISGAGQTGQILRRFVPEPSKKSTEGKSMNATLKELGLPPLPEFSELPALPKLPTLTP